MGFTALVYAKNSIPHKINDKAYSRAIRALFLTEEARIGVFLETQSSIAGNEELKADKSPKEIVNNEVVKSYVTCVGDLFLKVLDNVDAPRNYGFNSLR